jgi:hypothetical protein
MAHLPQQPERREPGLRGGIGKGGQKINCTTKQMGYADFDIFEGRMVRFHDDSKEVFSRVYVEFRTRLFELRKLQRQRNQWQEW